MSSKIVEMREATAWYLIYRYHNLPTEQITPPKVLSAVNDYIASNDLFLSFERAKVYDVPGAQLHVTTLWEQFKDWFQAEFSRNNFPRQSTAIAYFKVKWGPLIDDTYWENKTVNPTQMVNADDADDADQYLDAADLN